MKKNINAIIILMLTTIFFSCSPEKLENEVDFITFEGNSVSRDFGVVIDGETTKTVKVFATRKASSDRTYDIVVDTNKTTVDAAAYTVSSSVTIPANSIYGEISITVKDLNIVDGLKLVLNLVAPEGLASGGALEFNVSQLCEQNEVLLNILFDDYPEEVYWRIKNSNGEILFASKTPAGFGAYDGLTGGITEKFCMASGQYLFEIFDGYSDGAGAVELSLNGQTLFSSDGAYGAGTSATFTLP